MSRASGLMLITVLLLVAQSVAAEPEAKEPIVEKGLSQLFEMKFAGPDAGTASAAFLKDFKIQSPGGFDLSNGKVTLRTAE